MTPPLIPQRFDEEIAHGYSWQFGDEDVLVEYVSKLLLGQHRHVRKILEGVTSSKPISSDAMIEATIKKLSPDTDKKKEHRDGWLFQIMAWVGIRLVDRGKLLISPPHDRPADKGFDALAIVFDSQSLEPISMMICEEKATDNARNKFQQKVLPDFKDCSNGVRDPELMSELTTLLESSIAVKDDKVDAFLEKVMWNRERTYRVSLTTVGIKSDVESRAALFKDFDTVVPGAATFRRAETYQFDHLRDWMDQFSCKVIAKLNNIKGESGV